MGEQDPEPDEESSPGCLMALFLIPVFAALGFGIWSMTKKMDPSQVKLSDAESAAFETDLPPSTELLISTDPAVRAEQLAQSTSAAAAEEDERAISLANVEKLVGKPVSLRKLLNDRSEVDRLLGKPYTLSLLKSKGKLQAFLSGSTEIGLFLFSPAMTALSGNRRSLDAALSSQLVGRIGNSPAVQDLLHDQKALLRTINANAELAAFLKQPEVSDALEAFSKSGALEGLDNPAVMELIGKAKPAPKRG